MYTLLSFHISCPYFSILPYFRKSSIIFLSILVKWSLPQIRFTFEARIHIARGTSTSVGYSPENPITQLRGAVIEVLALNLAARVLCTAGRAEAKFPPGNAAHFAVWVLCVVGIESMSATRAFWGAAAITVYHIHFAGLHEEALLSASSSA